MRPAAPRPSPPAGEPGDAAVEQAVREHAALVYRVARAVLRNHHDAEDAAQEVFLRVLRLRRGLEGVRNPRTYLARVAFRVALDRRSRPEHVSLDDAAVSRLPSGETAADDRVAARQVRALVAEKMATLPGDLKHAVRLSTVAELSSPEIAEVLGIPEGTVRTRLMRARRILRVALAAALGLVLAAAGILLRRRETQETVAGKALVPEAAAAPVAPTRKPGISSKGEEAIAGATSQRRPAPAKPASSLVARAAGAAAAFASKRISFPSPVPLSSQERLLLAYVSAAAPPEAAALSGFLDEPAPLPPLPDDSPSFE